MPPGNFHGIRDTTKAPTARAFAAAVRALRHFLNLHRHTCLNAPLAPAVSHWPQLRQGGRSDCCLLTQDVDDRHERRFTAETGRA